MGYLALKIKPPDQIKPTHMTLWCWPYRDSSEREKWRLYDDAKIWRWRQEWAEVPILEDYREFCCRVCRELEL